MNAIERRKKISVDDNDQLKKRVVVEQILIPSEINVRVCFVSSSRYTRERE